MEGGGGEDGGGEGDGAVGGGLDGTGGGLCGGDGGGGGAWGGGRASRFGFLEASQAATIAGTATSAMEMQQQPMS